MGVKNGRHLLAVISAACVCAVFPQTASAIPPTIEDQWVTDLSSSDATLNAQINPNGLLTKYKLQIDTTGKFLFFQPDSCPLHPPGIACAQAIVEGEPLPAGLVQPPEMTLPASTESQHVSVKLSSIGATLQPETTYHFRAIAANSPEIIYGWDLTFTTPPPFEPPPSEKEEPGEEEPPGEEPAEEEPPEDEEPPRENDPTDRPPSGAGEEPTGSEPLAPLLSLSLPASSDTSKSTTRRKKHRKQRRVRARVAVRQARAIR